MSITLMHAVLWRRGRACQSIITPMTDTWWFCRVGVVLNENGLELDVLLRRGRAASLQAFDK